MNFHFTSHCVYCDRILTRHLPASLATCCILHWIKAPEKCDPLLARGTVQGNPKLLSGLKSREEIDESHGNKITHIDYMHVRRARYHVIYLHFPKSMWSHSTAVLHPIRVNIIQAERNKSSWRRISEKHKELAISYKFLI